MARKKPPRRSGTAAPAAAASSHGLARKPAPAKPHSQASQSKPTIPFAPRDDVLLVGEGDFSYARALLKHHRLRNLCATTFESREGLLAKHPQAAGFVEKLEAGVTGERDGEEEEEEDEDGDGYDDNDDDDDDNDNDSRDRIGREVKVLYDVDAAKLDRQKYIKKRAWDRVIFNFPHVGGKSTDVNRQVRYNQELLVSFFKSAMPLLRTGDSDARPGGQQQQQQAGAIVVTLFEGTPYTLWNIRDLARHAGLAVETSFVFQASAYPGYRHARTLGNLKSKEDLKANPTKSEEDKDGDNSEDEEREADISVGSLAGAWRGENRPARTYIFKLKDAAAQKPVQKKQAVQAKKGRKRKAGPDDSDSENEGDGVKKGRVPLLPQDELRPEPKGKHFKKSRPAPR